MAYSPAKHTSQKYGKDNEGHYHYKDKSGKPIDRFSTTPVKMESAKQEKYNLMHDNPVAKHGSWMSKHSQSRFSSPLQNNGGGEKPKQKPTTLQKFRNFVEPSLPSDYSGNRSNQMFDYDNDGDTIFNDSNNDGTMLSRGLKNVGEAASKIGKRIKEDLFEGGFEHARKRRQMRGGK